MATLLLFSDAVTNTYKETKKNIDSARLNDKNFVHKTLTELMKQSVFQGASRFGTNFIA